MLRQGNLLVANQNIDQSYSGEIDMFNHVSGKPLAAVVPHTDPNAPFDPDGIIVGPDERTLYVADIGDLCDTCGRVATFDVDTGHFLGNLDFSSFITSNGNPTPGEFHPRGLVFGPDGLLYITLRSLTNPVLGGILSYDLRTGAVRLVAGYTSTATDCSAELHRPDGLTFGPDGRLYVTSFRANASDIDRILIIEAATGACVDEIDLDAVGQARAFAQYIVFGPAGSLFVPTFGMGAVRRYDVRTKEYTNFVLPNAHGGPVGVAWGLTFGQTNPDTLAYGH
jgi:sugar lactone lactonase YvrE